MTRKLEKLLIFICGIIPISSCNNIKEQLHLAESLVNEHPRKTLSVLDSIPKGGISTKKLKADYAILYSMALDKSYMDLTTDSIISPAITYYDKRKASRNKMLMKYYHGRVMYNAENYAEAIVRFTEAEEIARDLSDTLYLGMVYMAKADTYNNQHNSAEELRAVKIASYYLEALGVESRKAEASYRLAVAYQNAGCYQTADSLYILAAGLARSCDNKLLYQESLKGYADVNVFNGKPENSVSTYHELLKSGDPAFSIHDYGKMACAHALVGNHEIAENIISQLNTYDECSYYNYIVKKAQNKTDLALHELEKSVMALRQTLQEISKESAIKAERDFYQIERIASEMESLRMKHILLFIVFCLCFAILILLRIRGHYNKVKEENLQLVESLNRAMKENDKLEELRGKSMKLFKSQFAVLRDLCETNTLYAGRKDKYRKIMSTVRNILSVVNTAEGKPSELEKIIDRDLDGAMMTLRNEVPRLKESDLVAISFFFAGFDAVLISRLMEIDTTKVYRMKHRLVERINAAAEKKNNEFLREIAGFIKS